MGIDVTLFAIGEVSEEELLTAIDFMNSRCPDSSWDGHSILERNKNNWNKIEVNTPYRWYGPGYERGYWPAIYNLVACTQAALPQCKVYFGPDTIWDDDIEEVNNGDLLVCWIHWLSPQGYAYHEQRIKWNEEMKQKREDGS